MRCAPLLLVLSVAIGGCGADPTAADASAGTDALAGTDDASGADANRCGSREEPLRFGLNIDPANPGGNPDTDTLRELGVRWVRIEWKHYADLDAQDATIEALRAASIRVLLLVDYSSVAAATPGSTGTPGQWTDYIDTQFIPAVTAVAERYGDGVDAYQIWNEPDLPAQPGYDVFVPAASYAHMLERSYEAIGQRSARPVITAGLATGDPGYLDAVKAAAGGSLFADAVAVHPYGQRAPDGWPSADWGFGDMSDLVQRYYDRAGVPIWITEIGTIDEPNQAAYLGNVYTMARERFGARLPVVLWFCYSDAMVAPFGLLAANGAPKAAFDSYRAAAPAWDPDCDSIDD